ncbi:MULTISPECIES: amidohydrolase family protein [Tepidanaerobacter]|uniref:amidohydrolase family protein n=1 Tax=Tepidanaerobacter TaxID=499228 RepID=UPI000ADC8D96|nr:MULTISPECIES: amidohydrolase family protein [Tepidanaerobacter]
MLLWDLVIKNGRILTMDSPHEQYKSVLIKNGIISDIVDNETAENLDACEVIDATGLVVMPGLVDCHTHLCEYATEGVHHIRGKSQTIAAISNYLDCLKSGITTIGDHHLGHPLLSAPLEVLKDAARNTVLNIKFAAGMCCLGTEPLAYTSSLRPGGNLTLDDLDNEHYARLAVESEFPGENIFITATVANLPCHLVPNGGKRIFDSEDIFEIVNIFHSLGKKIGAHIEGADNIQLFIDAGGDVVHHGHGANASQFDEMARKNIFLVATPHGGTSSSPNTPEDIYNALNAGVTTAIATDSYLPVHAKAVGLDDIKMVGPKDFLKICKPTFEYLSKHGVAKADCLKMITINAAKIMGLEAEIGSIAKLKRADIILSKGLPVFDFTDTESITTVIKDGLIEFNRC